MRILNLYLLNLSKTLATLFDDWREGLIVTSGEDFGITVSGDESITITGLAGDEGTSIGFELNLEVVDYMTSRGGWD